MAFSANIVAKLLQIFVDVSGQKANILCVCADMFSQRSTVALYLFLSLSTSVIPVCARVCVCVCICSLQSIHWWNKCTDAQRCVCVCLQ